MNVKTFVVGYISNDIYVVYGDGSDKAVLIDCGGGYNAVKAYCAEKGLSIEAVLLTHGHFDHMLNAAKWQADGAKIYVHALDADKLCSDKNLAYVFGKKIDTCIADVTLNGGETLELAGLSFKVVHTPGHSVGSVCYVVENVIFSGDTIFCGSVGRTDFPDGSLTDLVCSIKKLFAMEGDYIVYPGHEESTTLNDERENCPLKDML